MKGTLPSPLNAFSLPLALFESMLLVQDHHIFSTYDPKHLSLSLCVCVCVCVCGCLCICGCVCVCIALHISSLIYFHYL